MAIDVPTVDENTTNMNVRDENGRYPWTDANIPSAQGAISVTKERKQLGKWRHTLGIVLLLMTVFLWTASNFLASTIFADDSYSKPFFVTYVNTTFFILPLIPALIRLARNDPSQFSALVDRLRKFLQSRTKGHTIESAALLRVEHQDGFLEAIEPEELTLAEEDRNPRIVIGVQPSSASDPFDLAETAKLGFEFCLIWYLANYFVAACLEYTTVASSMILTSTSGVWTLLIGAVMRVERFKVRKLFGVLASLAGIMMISTIDLSGENDENRGSFPHKTPRQIAIGDSFAVLSAVLYGIYSVFLKKRAGDETRLSMPLFFGFVGLFNVVLLWPGLVILHFTGVEEFELPPDNRVLAIVLINSISSLIADYCWAYAMLLTSPLVVTIGLSMTIPLSLIGQIIINSQTSSAMYWVSAAIVVLSFIFINHESAEEEKQGAVVVDGTSSSIYVEDP
ncbi:MAG: hypothetical protein M1822_003813 [Bathelium mastoideum]|nr:MAG: hypothetical protein M1822_003813 [Bathelium mastoideum]